MSSENNMSLRQTNTDAGQACNYNQYPEPPYCECARTGKRSLSWFFWVPGLSNANETALDRENLNLSHEHIVFDQSNDNIGFGPDGIFSEDVRKYNYRYDDTCYDGSKMRKILANLDYKKSYNFIKNNCQDFVSYVRELYRR